MGIFKIKMNVKLFPTLLMLLDLAAACVYLAAGDIRHAIYWLAAAVLTASITY